MPKKYSREAHLTLSQFLREFSFLPFSRARARRPIALHAQARTHSPLFSFLRSRYGRARARERETRRAPLYRGVGRSPHAGPRRRARKSRELASSGSRLTWQRSSGGEGARWWCPRFRECRSAVVSVLVWRTARWTYIGESASLQGQACVRCGSGLVHALRGARHGAADPPDRGEPR